MPDKHHTIEAIQKLAKKVGRDSVILRYDPVFLSEKYSKGYHRRAFYKIAKMLQGYVVSHNRFGEGIVTGIVDARNDANLSQLAIVDFEKFGIKKFPLPASLQYFTILSEKMAVSEEDVKRSIECNIESYSEWVTALESINRNKDYIGLNLYEIIYERLLSTIGLKAKYIEDRFKEKGWS